MKKAFNIFQPIGIITVLVVCLWTANAVAQSCPSDAPLYCSNCGGYCCATDYPYCTTDCQCSSSSSQCPSETPLYCSNCGGYCCASDYPTCTTDCQCSQTGGSCPSATPLYCSNCGGYCCDSAHPVCTSDCQCTTSSGSCPSATPLYCSNCGGYCCDTAHPICTQDCQCSTNTTTCPPEAPLYCSNCSGYCCDSTHPICTEDCLCQASSGGQDAGSPECGSGTVLCGGSYCTPDDRVCCDYAGHPELNCPSGTQCTANGTCVDVDGGTTLSCDTGSLAVLGTCDTASCACAISCGKNEECGTGCCNSGYCAPKCVCDGAGTLVLSCFQGETSGGSNDKPQSSNDDGSGSGNYPQVDKGDSSYSICSVAAPGGEPAGNAAESLVMGLIASLIR